MKSRKLSVIVSFAGLIVAASLVSIRLTTPACASAALSNKLIFRTPQGGVSVPVGQKKVLGTIDVSSFSKLRVVINERPGSSPNADIQFTMFESTEAVGVLSVIHAKPGFSSTKIYDVPGTSLEISAKALTQGSGAATVDVLVYGSE